MMFLIHVVACSSNSICNLMASNECFLGIPVYTSSIKPPSSYLILKTAMVPLCSDTPASCSRKYSAVPLCKANRVQPYLFLLQNDLVHPSHQIPQSRLLSSDPKSTLRI